MELSTERIVELSTEGLSLISGNLIGATKLIVEGEILILL